MKHSIYPKRVRIIFIGGVIFTACFIFACSIILKYINPDDAVTLRFLQWRYPLIASYLLFSSLCIYLLGITGSCTFSYDGITMKRSFREKFIPWDAIEKITPTANPALYLTIEFKPEHKNQYISKSNSIWSFANTDEVIDEIKQYNERIVD